MSDSSPLRFGLVGYGLFGKHHARAIAQTAGAQLSAIAVVSPKSQQAARAECPQADVYGDCAELLQRDDIDIVDIVVPNQLHHAIAKAALLAGKHVLLEKPMALTVADCDELVELAKQQQRMLAIGHELRLSSLWAGVRRLIGEGAIGDVLHVLIELSRFPHRQGSGGWRYDQQRVGSWILEEPIHFFDLARWYLAGRGEPQSVYARANGRAQDPPQLSQNFTAIVNFSGGAYAVISQTLAAFGHHQSAKIAGTRGTIWASWSAADARSERPVFSLRYGQGEDVHEVAFTRPASELHEVTEEIAAITRCIRQAAPPPCSAEEGRWSTRLCLAAQQSVESGQIVSLENASILR